MSSKHFQSGHSGKLESIDLRKRTIFSSCELVRSTDKLFPIFPASSFYTVWKAGGQPKWPSEQQQFVGLLRRDFVVRRYELTKPQHDLLLALQRGDSLGVALFSAAQSTQVDVEELTAAVGAWFQFWAEEKFFARAI